MRFPPTFIDEIKARVRVSDVVGRKVKLHKRGREFVGLSPFKNEKTPSFTVNDDKGFYHCFSSGEHGDAIGFLMNVDGLSFNEAIEKLAGEAGLELPEQTRHDRVREKRRASLYDVVAAAAEWFAAQLQTAQGSGPAREYLLRRGVDEALIREFGIGFAPQDRYACKNALTKLGIDEQLLLEAGLIIQPDDGRPAYDRFRHRIVFPITDARGRVIAFGGRALDKDAPAKYLNSPETPIFHKGSVLYNFPRAREAAREFKQAIVVEGYMDVIALHKAGFTCAVAPLGTALTEAQLNLLWRIAPEPVLAFDGDEAGSRAANRVVERALPVLQPGRSVRFSFLPQGSDPDDVIREHGAAGMNDALNRSRGLADMLWSREVVGERFATPEQKASLARQFEQAIGLIQDKTVRDYYRFDFKVRLSEFFWRLGQKRGSAGQNRMPSLISESPELDELNYERMILGMLVEYPDLGNAHIEEINPDLFAGEWHAEFFNALYSLYLAGNVEAAVDIYRQLPPRFYMVLNQVHGDERAGDSPAARRPRGHRFHARFPMALHRPPHALVERCFFHFLGGLYIYSMGREKAEIIAELETAMSGGDAESESRSGDLFLQTEKLDSAIQHERKQHADEEAAILSLITEFFSSASRSVSQTPSSAGT